jgi:hypothetical protein
LDAVVSGKKGKEDGTRYRFAVSSPVQLFRPGELGREARRLVDHLGNKKGHASLLNDACPFLFLAQTLFFTR